MTKKIDPDAWYIVVRENNNCMSCSGKSVDLMQGSDLVIGHSIHYLRRNSVTKNPDGTFADGPNNFYGYPSEEPPESVYRIEYDENMVKDLDSTLDTAAIDYVRDREDRIKRKRDLETETRERKLLNQLKKKYSKKKGE